MRLHLTAAAVSFCCAAPAFAEEPVHAAKPLEPVRASGVQAGKTQALFAPKVQLFVEQKDAPAVSKTAVRAEATQRLAVKPKD